MSQVIMITTEEQFKSFFTNLASGLQPALPPEVIELEKLKRLEALSEKQIEKLYSIKACTLRKWRTEGKGPQYIKTGEKVLYTHDALRKFLDSGKQKTYVR